MNSSNATPPSATSSWQEEMEREFARVEDEKRQPSDAPRRREQVMNFNTLAAQAIRNRDEGKAIELYEEALKIEPNPVSFSSLGMLHTERKDYPQAFQAFWQALDTDSRYAPAIVGLGTLLMKQDDFVLAKKKFKQALQIDPRDSYALTGLGKAFAKMGMTRAAADQFEKALSLNEHDFVARAHLGLILYRDGKGEKAYEHFTKVLRDDRGNKVAGFLKAQIEDQDGRPQAARNTLIPVLDRALDESCLVLYFSITSREDEGHQFYAAKIGAEKYAELGDRIERCAKNPRWEMIPRIEDEIDDSGLMQTLARGGNPVVKKDAGFGPK